MTVFDLISSRMLSLLVVQAGRKVAEGGVDPSVAREEEYKHAPHSFVFHRGHVGKAIRQLVADMRRVMEPYTASRLRVGHSLLSLCMHIK